MRNTVLVVVLLAVVGYGVIKAASIYKARADLAQRVEHYLDFVDETSIDSVKQDLVRDARRFGIELRPENIHIVYADTGQRTVAQKFLEGRVAGFSNKQVAISVRYADRMFGIPVRQVITQSKIKQVQVRPVRPGLEPAADWATGE
jgi:hypothetical protein